MDKLLVWYNPNTNSFYHKWGKGFSSCEGDVNQYDHILVQCLECDSLTSDVPTLRRCLSLGDSVKLIRYNGRYNPYLKYCDHFNFLDILYFQ